ncbi:MAG TPA: 4Fe-4S binding protein, partial [Desulfobaccales bacterium]|nr:4Fe-4S binding protein [Desulfobaccales bacterium]
MGLIFYSERCIACGQCVETCPFGVLRLEGEQLVIGEGCNLCGACIEVCEVEALALPETEGVAPRPAVPPDGVWVFAEQRRGELGPVTVELLGEARRLAESLNVKVAAVLLGDQVDHLPDTLFSAGADKVYVAEHPLLKDFLEETYAAALTELARKFQPEIILAGATYLGRAFIPRVAAALQTGLTADCTAFAIDPEKRLLLQTRPAFGGNIMATIICPTRRPQMATVRPRVFKKARPDEKRQGQVIRVDFK